METVSAFKGDIPEGEYERTWQASRDLTVVSSASMSESTPSAMYSAFYTTRRSEAKPR
jgi:hypothetical protein